MLALEHSAENGHFITGEGVVRLLQPALAMSLPSGEGVVRLLQPALAMSLPSVKFILAAVAVTTSVPMSNFPVRFCLNGGLHSLSAICFVLCWTRWWYNSVLFAKILLCQTSLHYVSISQSRYMHNTTDLQIFSRCNSDPVVWSWTGHYYDNVWTRERTSGIHCQQQTTGLLMLLLLLLLYED